MYNSPALIAASNENGAGRLCYAGNNVDIDFYRVDPVESLTQSAYQDHVTSAIAEDKWFPCHAARICGGVGGATDNFAVANTPAIAPDSAVVSPSELSQGNRTISLAYSDVPEDCIIGLQVIAVDIAGNTSGRVSDYTRIRPNSGEIQTFRGLVTNAGGTNPHYNTADEVVSANIVGGQQSQGVHRAWCGNTNGVAEGSVGNPGTNTWGTVTEHGIWCRPPTPAENISDLGTTGNTVTPNWQDSGLPISYYRPHGTSTNTAANPVNGANASSSSDLNWRNDFPNGYYTCRPGGCCFSTSPGVCTPWSN